MALMHLNISPLGTKTTSVGDYVAEFQKLLEREQIRHTLTDMGTIIEGSMAELLAIAARLHELPFDQGAMRVVTQIMIDDRRDKQVHLGDKVAAVNRRLA